MEEINFKQIDDFISFAKVMADPEKMSRFVLQLETQKKELETLLGNYRTLEDIQRYRETIEKVSHIQKSDLDILRKKVAEEQAAFQTKIEREHAALDVKINEASKLEILRNELLREAQVLKEEAEEKKKSVDEILLRLQEKEKILDVKTEKLKKLLEE